MHRFVDSERREWRRAGVALVLAAAGGGLARPALAAPPTWAVRFNAAATEVTAGPWSFSGDSTFEFLGRRVMAVDAQDNVYVAGTVIDPATQQDFLVEKYDSAGTLLWLRRLDSGLGFVDTVTGLALAADAVYVTGQSCRTNNNLSVCTSDFLTVKYDTATGNQVWVKPAVGPSGNKLIAPRVAVDAGGTPFVAGTVYYPGNPDNITDFITIKYNQTTGAEAWRSFASTPTLFTNGSQDIVETMGVGADGHVVVSGSGNWGVSGHGTLLTVKHDSGNGAQMWIHSATSIHDAVPHALVLDAASNPIVVGQTSEFGDPYTLTLKYRASDGAQLWMQHVNYAAAGGDESAHDVALDGAGNVYVTGRLRIADAWSSQTVKYEAGFGTPLWLHNYGGGVPGDHHIPRALALNGAGTRLFVAGYRGDVFTPPTDFFVESLNTANGNSAPLNVLTNVLDIDFAVDVVTDSAGNAILTGGSKTMNGSQIDLMVVKYSPALAELWRAADPDLESEERLGTFSSPEQGRKKIAVDGLGNTVVVGSTNAAVGGSANLLLVQKYGPGGNLLWSRSIDSGTGGDSGVAVVLNGTADVYVTGFSNGTSDAGGVGYDILTLRLASSNGSTVWTHRYNGPANNSDVPLSIALGADRVFVAGFSQGPIRQNLIVLGYPVANGAAPWVAELDFPGGSAAYAVASGCRESSRGQCIEGVYITGVAINSMHPTSGNNFLTALFDAGTGALVTGLTQGSNAIGYSIATYGNPSTVVATGRIGDDWMTTAFQGNSQLPLWTVIKDFDGHGDHAFDAAFDLVGNALVTGYATQNPDLNKQAATVKYNSATGAEMQTLRFGTVEYDVTAYGVAIDLAGDVYLGGSRLERLSGKNDLMFLTYTNDYANDLVFAGSGFVDSLGSDDQGSALAVERVSGDAVVAGTSFAINTPGDLLLAKFRASEKGRFFTITPCRLYDSRNTDGPFSGAQIRVIPALGAVGNCASLTPAVKNLAINVTVTSASAGGFVQLYAGDIATPNTSVISFSAGQTRANNALVNIATNAAGTIAIRSGLTTGQTVHVIVDLVGYFD